MPITIIRLDKPFKVKCEDAWIHVCPLTLDQDAGLRARYTQEGVFDEEGYLREKLDQVVTGWEGVEDQNKEPAPFARGYVRGLPIAHQRRVLRCLEGGADPLVDRSGTSLPPSIDTPNSTLPMKA